MKKKKFQDEELPLYEIVIDNDDNTGIRFVSIVAEPAIEMMGMAFNNNQVRDFEFKEDKDKQIIVGPAMIPGKKILRKDDDGNKYMVVFTKETIQQMVAKFNAYGSNRRINVDHTKEMVEAFVMENWIVEDPYYDKCRMYGFDVPVGTWMISVKIEDPEFWANEVRGAGKYGFSIEGLMGQKPMSYNSVEDYIDELSDEEVIQLFRDATEDIVYDFMASKGNKKEPHMTFANDDEISIEDINQPQMFWTYVGPDDEKTRPFCHKMLQLDKYWTDDDLKQMTDLLGYDFQQYFGSYNCRHKLQRVFLVGEPSTPTTGQKDKLRDIQEASGLLGFSKQGVKEFPKK